MKGIKSTLDRFTVPSRVAACVVVINEDGRLSIDMCIVTKKGQSLSVAQKETDLSLENAKKVIGTLPVIISLAGDSIIHKKFLKSKEQHWSALIPNVIPKFKSHDFFIQYAALSEVSGYLSFARRPVLEAVIEEFAAKGFILYDIILGPFALHNLSELMADGIIKTLRYEIEISGKLITQFRMTAGANVSSITVGQGVVESDILIQYASCIPFFTGEAIAIEHFETNPASASRQKFEEASKVKYLAKVATAMVTVFFICSAMAFTVTSRKLTRLRESLGVEVRRSQPGEHVVAEFTAIRKTVRELGWESRHYLSFYADRIAITKPQDVVLTQLKIFPVMQSAKRSELTKFNPSVITISGVCSSNEQLARWIDVLSKEKWIAAVQNQWYQRRDPDKPATFSFDINIIH